MCQTSLSGWPKWCLRGVISNTCMHAAPPNGMLRACSCVGCGQGVHSLLSGQLQGPMLAALVVEDQLMNAAPSCGRLRVCSH